MQLFQLILSRTWDLSSTSCCVTSQRWNVFSRRVNRFYVSLPLPLSVITYVWAVHEISGCFFFTWFFSLSSPAAKLVFYWFSFRSPSHSSFLSFPGDLEKTQSHRTFNPFIDLAMLFTRSVSYFHFCVSKSLLMTLNENIKWSIKETAMKVNILFLQQGQ